MRCVTLLTLAILIAHAFTLYAEDADEVREKGIAALKESQNNPRAIVDAARLFVRAGAMYGNAGDEEKNVEMNSFLYWCKKKMTLADIDIFTKGGEAAVTSKLAAVEKAAPKADEAQKWFDRADQFATKNPNEHLLIAIRFYEVADRFKGVDASMQAQDRSLKEMLLEKSNAVKTVPQPTVVKPTETVANDVAKRPVPSVDDLKKSEKLIKDLLKADYVKSDAPSRFALVSKLLQQAEENKNDVASYYVLLHEARDLTVFAGDCAKAAEVQKRLREAFNQDFAAILLDLRKLEPTSKTADSAAALATLFSLSADEALIVENFDEAVHFSSRAGDLMPIIKDDALRARLKAEILRAQAIKRDSVAATAAQQTLSTKPDDTDANLIAGKFALLAGNVGKSMPMLAKGKDTILSGLAKRELASSADATEQTLLADGWFDRAEKETSGYLKTRMQERAVLWYGNALPALTGIQKVKIEGRLKTLWQATNAGRVMPPALQSIPWRTIANFGSWSEYKISELKELKIVKSGDSIEIDSGVNAGEMLLFLSDVIERDFDCHIKLENSSVNYFKFSDNRNNCKYVTLKNGNCDITFGRKGNVYHGTSEGQNIDVETYGGTKDNMKGALALSFRQGQKTKIVLLQIK